MECPNCGEKHETLFESGGDFMCRECCIEALRHGGEVENPVDYFDDSITDGSLEIKRAQ